MGGYGVLLTLMMNDGYWMMNDLCRMMMQGDHPPSLGPVLGRQIGRRFSVALSEPCFWPPRATVPLASASFAPP